MKRIIYIIIILLFTTSLFAKERDSVNKFVFPRHEIKVSFGDAIHINQIWDAHCMGNLSISYSYRCLKWLWVGVNVVNSIGTPKHYYIREYDIENNFSDYRYTVRNYGLGFIPEIRFSFLNRKHVTLYGGIAFGYTLMIRNNYGFQSKITGGLAFQVTAFAFSCYFGKNQKIFLGGEFGSGNRGIFIIHGGYRF